MKLKEFCEITGATPRLLRYWAKNGMDFTKEGTETKQGQHSEYDEKMIPRIKLITQLNKEHRIPVIILNSIFWMYETGWIQISGPPNGIRMEWDPE